MDASLQLHQQNQSTKSSNSSRNMHTQNCARKFCTCCHKTVLCMQHQSFVHIVNIRKFTAFTLIAHSFIIIHSSFRLLFTNSWNHLPCILTLSKSNEKYYVDQTKPEEVKAKQFIEDDDYDAAELVTPEWCHTHRYFGKLFLQFLTKLHTIKAVVNKIPIPMTALTILPLSSEIVH
jgi:hypothetical protein